MALINKLSAIGDAIREKTGKEDLLTLDQMPEEIKGISGGGEEVEPIVIEDSQCQYLGTGVLASKMIELYGNLITTKNIRYVDNMFYRFQGTNIPFDINCDGYTGANLQNMFYYATQLKSLPKIYNVVPSAMTTIFANCLNLREIPEDYFDSWDFTYMDNLTGTYTGGANGVFSNCYSLRKAPLDWIKYTNPYAYNASQVYYNLFSNCYSFDEILNLPVPFIVASNTSNLFYYTFNKCWHLKNLTFKLNDETGMPENVKWKNQTIDLSSEVGYASSSGFDSMTTRYNSGIDPDKRVYNTTTYESFKDDPNYWTTMLEYSRYNHDSAVATINSLPDASAYLATAGGTNTIKFKGNAGSLTDGGAINTLTEEEIAVATNKGWTITFV